jgi:single-strand DNA-binding protein
MNALRNKVQLIGHLGNDPEIKILMEEKLNNFTLATNEATKMTKEKKEETQWHRLIAWGKRQILLRNLSLRVKKSQ